MTHLVVVVAITSLAVIAAFIPEIYVERRRRRVHAGRKVVSVRRGRDLAGTRRIFKKNKPRARDFTGRRLRRVRRGKNESPERPGAPVPRVRSRARRHDRAAGTEGGAKS